MQLRPKTKKRLTILLVSSITGAAIAVAIGAAGLRRYENHLLKFRADGMSAYHRGDYRTAAKNLGNYLGNDRIDPPAIFAYAISRSRLPRPDLSNLLDARRLLNRYLELNPTDIEAKHQLLDIYQKLHYPAETAQTAADLLSKNPDDVPALTAQLKQLIHDQKFGPALQISMRLNELAPFDLRTQETTFDLMSRTQKSPADIIARGNQLLAAHPNDPRFQLVRALADYYTGDADGTRRWLRQAASTPSTDTDFILLLAGSFDHMDMPADARNLLKNTAAQPASAPVIRAKYAQRLWQINDLDSASAVLKNLNPDDPSCDAQSIGLLALIRFTRDPRTSVDSTLLHALHKRIDDPTATAWALLLDNISDPSSNNIAHRIQNLQSAERLDPDNPNIRFFLAQQYLLEDESELALQCFRQTLQIEPEWSSPNVKIAQILMDRQRFTPAASAAQSACDADPNSSIAKITLALANYGRLDPAATAAEIQPVLNSIQELRLSDAADPKLLAANVDLLARLNRTEEATNLAVTSTIDSPSALHQLALIDVADHLGINQTLCSLAADCPISTPAQALEQIQVFAVEGDAAHAGKFLPVMQNHSAVDWQLATAQAEESLHDSNAAMAWQQLCEAQPHSPSVQLAAIHSNAVAADRTLMDSTIERVKAITSEDAMQWKLARARWQLEDVKDAKNSANAAAAIMAEVARQEPQYIQPQLIWADALLKLGDTTGAINHLRAAAQIEPDNTQIKLRLTQLLTQQGQPRNTADTLPSF